MKDNDTITENAINWARIKMESTEYRFQCLRFVEDAMELSNDIEIFGGSSAKESADIYKVTNTGTPPKGAFAFCDCFGTIDDKYENWGHVGLSLGSGDIIHAWDKVRIDNFRDVELLQSAPGWSSLKYIGWASIEYVLGGYKDRVW